MRIMIIISQLKAPHILSNVSQGWEEETDVTESHSVGAARSTEAILFDFSLKDTAGQEQIG